MPLNTLTALILPLVAFFHGKMGTIGGKSPAIVKSPDQLRLILAEPGKQKLQVAIMTMDIMQMHNVRLDVLQLGDQLPGGQFGIKSIVSQDPGLQRLKFDISAARAGDSGRKSVCFAAEDIVFNILCIHELTDANADLACTANAAGGIHLYDLHSVLSLPISRREYREKYPTRHSP
jgi:hypothetical protein